MSSRIYSLPKCFVDPLEIGYRLKNNFHFPLVPSSRQRIQIAKDGPLCIHRLKADPLANGLKNKGIDAQAPTPGLTPGARGGPFIDPPGTYISHN